jgi:RHS repeat-associated protein
MSWTTYTTVNGQILHQDKDGVGTHLIPDTLGNIIATIDEAGTVTSQTEYLPYGEVQSQTGANPTPFGFVGAWGYYSDSEATTYIRARTYSPVMAAWVTSDPLWPGETGYSYAEARPNTERDPSGLAIVIGRIILPPRPITLPRPITPPRPIGPPTDVLPGPMGDPAGEPTSGGVRPKPWPLFDPLPGDYEYPDCDQSNPHCTALHNHYKTDKSCGGWPVHRPKRCTKQMFPHELDLAMNRWCNCCEGRKAFLQYGCLGSPPPPGSLIAMNTACEQCRRCLRLWNDKGLHGPPVHIQPGPPAPTIGGGWTNFGEPPMMA